ncbi:hypothetical protein pb186bvf_006385 [Paramecium bursaria]
MARMKSGRFGSSRVQQCKPLLPLNLNMQSLQKMDIDEEIARNIVQDTIKETEEILKAALPPQNKKNGQEQIDKKIKKKKKTKVNKK